MDGYYIVSQHYWHYKGNGLVFLVHYTINIYDCVGEGYTKICI